jgi:hypothetical protein
MRAAAADQSGAVSGNASTWNSVDSWVLSVVLDVRW